MLFNSADFLFFFALVFVIWLFTPALYKWVVLLIASLVFFAWEHVEYLLLLIFTILVTYYSCLQMGIGNAEERRKKKFLYLSVGINVFVLIVFKYLGLFTEITSNIVHFFSPNSNISIIKLVLPIGISFYTFQSIGYTYDIYYGIRKPEKHLGYYALFISFFPQILSGPIGRSNDLLPQLNKSFFLLKNMGYGLQRFTWGLFKKVVIADRLDVYVNDIYSNIPFYQGSVLWLGTLLFAFQLYADFSGYTDMAIGIARIFGVNLAENFNFPFISKNITEFWRRWHLSLSSWLRDYVYMPIQFAKKKWKKWATVFAIMMTFLICGLWHGAKFTFIIFGMIQGIALVYEMFTKENRKRWSNSMNSYLYNICSWLLTFIITLISFVFFRATDTSSAFLLLKKSFTSFYDINALVEFIKKADGSRFVFTAFLLCAFIVIDRFVSKAIIAQDKNQYILNLLFSALVVLIILFGTFGKVNFIYFQF